jgi:hypothetical protein
MRDRVVKLSPALALLAASVTMAGCNGHTYGNDEFARYVQRKDTVIFGSGDAKEVNARTHMVAAWPQGVGDRRIPMSGPRAVRAIDCYYTPPRQQQQAQGSPANQISLNIQTGGSQAQQQQKSC